MAFSNGYAVAVVVDGNVVDERQDGVAAIPFGVEYAIRLINKNGKDALAVVYIDGQRVTDGGLIIRAHTTTNLERPTDKSVRFRFASTDSDAAASHGKAGPDVDGSKGLIKIEWYPGRTYRPYMGAFSQRSSLHQDNVMPRGSDFGLMRSKSLIGSHQEQKTSGGIVAPDYGASQSSVTDYGALQSGVTVEGGYSDQKFQYVSFDADYSQQTVVLVKLKGYVAEEGVPRTGTRYCPQCRTKTKKSSDRFCRHCGENLLI